MQRRGQVVCTWQGASGGVEAATDNAEGRGPVCAGSSNCCDAVRHKLRRVREVRLADLHDRVEVRWGGEKACPQLRVRDKGWLRGP